MLFRLFIVLLCCFGTQSSFAFKLPIEIIDSMDDSTIIIFADKDDINQSSTWIPTKGNLPLTIPAMLEKVYVWLETKEELKNLEVNEIELKKIHNHSKENYWYYLVQLSGVEKLANKKTHYIAVLMSGKILSAIKEPKSYK